jgi:LAGLIDADG endonuclease
MQQRPRGQTRIKKMQKRPRGHKEYKKCNRGQKQKKIIKWIGKSRGRCYCRFKTLHESYYRIAKFQDILEILIPIFSKYYLTTSKFLDFQYFKAAAEIRKTSYMEKRRLNKEELNKILKIKSGMNSQRLQFNINNFLKNLNSF